MQAVKTASTNTAGLVALRRQMNQRGVAIPELAAQVGVSVERVRQIVKGDDNPGFALAGKLASAIGFDAGLWFDAVDEDALAIEIPNGYRPGPGRGHKGKPSPGGAGSEPSAPTRDVLRATATKALAQSQRIQTRKKKTKPFRSPKR